MHQAAWLRTLFGGAILALTVVAAPPAFACSCVTTWSGQPACQARWTHAAVFVGRVVRMEPSSRTIDIGSGMRPFVARERRVHFVVTEAFSGVTTREIDITTGVGGGDCGYAFALDQEYLVYAYKEADGTLGTGICSPTRKPPTRLRILPFYAACRRMQAATVESLVSCSPIPALTANGSPFAAQESSWKGRAWCEWAPAVQMARYEIRVPTGQYRVRATLIRPLHRASTE